MKKEKIDHLRKLIEALDEAQPARREDKYILGRIHHYSGLSEYRVMVYVDYGEIRKSSGKKPPSRWVILKNEKVLAHLNTREEVMGVLEAHHVALAEELKTRN